MSAIRSRDNKTELAFRKVLHARRLRFRLHPSNVLGKPDIAFPRERIAVFVDGDFWHARVLREVGPEAFPSLIRTPRKDYWVTKFGRRIRRDDEVNSILRKEGWIVLRFWESDLKRDYQKAASIVQRCVTRRRKKLLEN